MRQEPVTRETFDALVAERDTLAEEVIQLRAAMTMDVQFPETWKLSPKHQELLRHLLAREVISRDSAMALLYGSYIDDPPSPEIINVFVSQLRSRIRPYGGSIARNRGGGWSISPEIKQHLKAMISEAQP